MRTNFFLGLILFAVNFAKAQECKHISLSDKFEFDILFTRFPEEELEKGYCCKIDIRITNRKSNDSQEIAIYTQFIFAKDHKDCNDVKSFSKGINTNLTVSDNYSGNFIVCDLNFDGLEDFAILSDSGGNGGSTYNFYIQDSNGKFLKDGYLTNTMEFFPMKINKTKKRLTIYVHASAYDLRKTIFGYNTKGKKWRIISNSMVGYEDCPATIEVN